MSEFNYIDINLPIHHSNKFQYIAYEFYKYISIHKKEITKSNRFTPIPKVNLPENETKKLISDINYGFNSFTHKFSDMEDCLKSIKEFAYFLLSANKSYFYQNYDYQNLYSVKTKDGIDLHIQADSFNTNIVFKFRQTNVSIPQSEATNSLLEFINGEDSSEGGNKLEIAIMEIQKNEDDTESFTFMVSIPNSPPEDEDKKIMINSALHITTDMIFDTFIYILDNYVSKVTRRIPESQKITIDEVIQWSMDMGIPINYLSGDI